MMLCEPSTVVTDLIVSVVCLYSYLRLRAGWHSSPRATHQRFLLSFFALMGLSTFFGAFLSHGLSHVLSSVYWKFPSWLLNIAAISCFGLYALFRRPLKAQKALTATLLAESLAILAWTLAIRTFLPAEVHIGLVLLLIVLPLQLPRMGQRESRFICSGILLLLPLPIVLIRQWSPVPWLNANDVSHLMIALAVYLIYAAQEK